MHKFDKLPVSALMSFRQVLDTNISLDDLVAFARSKTRIFFDAEKWIAAMERVDLCFGTRLHGNMAAIAASTPGCVISHDSRTHELAEDMLLPRLDENQLQQHSEMPALTRGIVFDPNQFDLSRAEKRSVYSRQFAKQQITTTLEE